MVSTAAYSYVYIPHKNILEETIEAICSDVAAINCTCNGDDVDFTEFYNELETAFIADRNVLKEALPTIARKYGVEILAYTAPRCRPSLTLTV